MKTITEDNYVDQAQSVILSLQKKTDKRGKPIQLVTTSKLRNLLAMSADIYNEAVALRTDQLTEEINSRIQYLRIRFIYESGREEKVKDLVTTGKILEILQEIQGSKKNYILFSHYMEALVAFRKFYGGKDD